MTNEELKMHLLLLKENARGIEDTIIQNVKKESFLWIIEELIKALEQQPSDDCISREDTLKEFKRVYFDNATVIRCAELILGAMPSVTPERPKEDGVEDFIKHKIDYLEELASIETNEGRWREEEKYLYAISVLEEVVEYMNTSGGKEDV